jgi:hypothetical protein
VDWNNDGLHDFLVGDAIGNVHIYINQNNNTHPVFEKGSLLEGYDVEKKEFGVLDVGLRATPEVYDWNSDGKKDLIIGNFDGNILIYLNTGSDNKPAFEKPPQFLYVKNQIFKVSEGGRAAPRVFDWDRDGKDDLLIGSHEGYIYFLKNEGTKESPSFKKSTRLRLTTGRYLRYPDNGGVPRSRLYIEDYNGDGQPDILAGGRDGKIMVFIANK